MPGSGVPGNWMSCPEPPHLFSEPGALEEVARLAEEWFLKYLVQATG